jgi:hypothetical protein
VTVVSVSGLLNGSPLRPVNPYVKVRLNKGGLSRGAGGGSGASSRFETKAVMLGGGDASFDPDKHGSEGIVATSKEDGFILVQAMDWKPVKHRLLGEAAIPLQKLKVNGGEATGGRCEGEIIEVRMKMRWCRTGDKWGVVTLSYVYDDIEKWWIEEEWKMRDAKKEEEDRIHEEEERAFLEAKRKEDQLVKETEDKVRKEVAEEIKKAQRGEQSDNSEARQSEIEQTKCTIS